MIHSRDGLRLMLDQAPPGFAILPHWTVNAGNWNVYFWNDVVDTLFAEFRVGDAKIDCGLSDKPYDVREFGIRYQDGYDIGFDQLIAKKPLPADHFAVHLLRGRQSVCNVLRYKPPGLEIVRTAAGPASVENGVVISGGDRYR